MEWKKRDGLRKDEDCAFFYSPDTNSPLLGTGAGQYNYCKFIYVGGDVSVGVCGGGTSNNAARVNLQRGTVYFDPAISHDGKNHALSQPSWQEQRPVYFDSTIFIAQPGQTVYFRVSRVKVGQFKLEMMVEGGPWGHLTPEGETLRPKTKKGVAMEGMRLWARLVNDKAIVSDLRVGRCVDVVEGE